MVISSKFALTFAASVIALTPAQAAIIYLDFENITDYPNNSDVRINGYYNGGTASNGNSGPNLGVEFTSEALLLCMNTIDIDCSNTSRGGQGIPTSARGALFYPGANPTMNVSAGFDTGFAGVYSAPFIGNQTISIYSELNGSGTLLASMTLASTIDGAQGACADYGNPNFCPFANFSIGFAGTARSVVFGGTPNAQVFDDLTFGSRTAGGIPEPTTWAMMIAGFGLAGFAARRSRVASLYTDA